MLETPGNGFRANDLVLKASQRRDSRPCYHGDMTTLSEPLSRAAGFEWCTDDGDMPTVLGLTDVSYVIIM